MAVRPVIKGFEFFLERLLKGFRSVKNREPDNLEMILIKQEAAQKTKDANKVVDVDFDKGRWKDTKGITSLIESGDVKIGTAPKTPPYQKSQADIEFEIMERIKADNKKAVEAFEKRNPKTPKKFFYGGFVEQPELGPTAHGSEALASRTRLAAPGSTSTTSTGLNYLLAEDNDNQRVPFSKGKGVDLLRRGFLKTAGAIGAGIGALKSGLLGFGEKTAPVVEKAVETVQETPQYFFDLVYKIKMLGKKSKVGPQERVNEFSYTGKNGDEYLLTEDISTGDVRIVKDKLGGVRVSEDEVVDGIADRSVMEYKSGKGMADETTGKKTPVDEYDEYKVEFDQDGTEGGADIIDESVQKEIIEEVSEKITKKADGGRAGYFLGGKVAAGILKLLKDKKKIKAAYDNIFPSGDYKYDAEMVAESLVENNPKVFGNRLYEDLTDAERFEVYGAGLEEASTNFAKRLKLKRAMDKASRPTKTLEGIEKTGTIDISDDAVAEEFATFMKETDPVGHAKIQKVVDDANQQLELKRFKTKGRKKYALGGLANMLGE